MVATVLAAVADPGSARAAATAAIAAIGQGAARPEPSPSSRSVRTDPGTCTPRGSPGTSGSVAETAVA